MQRRKQKANNRIERASVVKEVRILTGPYGKGVCK
jgi:hypothetical protein